MLYNEDERAARLAIPLLEAEGLIVGDQQPYSGKLLNATMNRHAEAHGRPYFGIEIRQDQIGDEAGQAEWAERLVRIADRVALGLAMSRHGASRGFILRASAIWYTPDANRFRKSDAARLPFPYLDPRPQHGRRPRVVARDGHEGRRLRQADRRRRQQLHPVRAGPRRT